MPFRKLVTEELSELLSALSHPARLRIVEELRDRELDVNSLQDCLGISHSGVSQHLSVLRHHRLVQERRQGKNVYYHLLQPELADWLLDGLNFITPYTIGIEQLQAAVEEARQTWGVHRTETKQ